MNLDRLIMTPEFKTRVQEADAYAKLAGLDRWATRIAWVGLVFNVKAARRFAMRRQNHEASPAWAAYCNLITAGLFSLDPEGIYYDTAPEWETDDGVMEWFDTLSRVADGEEVPEGFPHLRPERPLLRVVNG
ncbi:hypothetical protein N9917_03525 [Deltaproteobacteria bacterium]|nr:hypothetical protein [Deltaproteobacteria bacterium]